MTLVNPSCHEVFSYYTDLMGRVISHRSPSPLSRGLDQAVNTILVWTAVGLLVVSVIGALAIGAAELFKEI